MQTTLDQKLVEAIAPGVVIRGLRKTYRTPTGPVEAVRDLDLTATRGETVALLGPERGGQVDGDRPAARAAGSGRG
jgi:hypothetical protein